MKFDIIELDWGTASRVGDKIYINKHMKEYPGLYSAILNHEKKHSSGWSLGDLRLDMHDPELSAHKKDFYKFMFRHPMSFKQFCPLTKYDGVWTLDYSLLVVEVLLIALFYIILRVLI